MNKKEILKKIYDYVHSDEFDGFGAEEMKINGLKIKYVAGFGGEDQGSEYWDVFKVTEGKESMFVKLDAYYTSYDGTSYEDCEPYEVEKYEKLVTAWRKVK